MVKANRKRIKYLKAFYCLFPILMLLVLQSCTKPAESELKMARKQVDLHEYDKAIENFEKVIKRDSQSEFSLEAARDLTQLAHFQLKNYKLALKYYQFIVLHSEDEKERVQSQKQIARIYFDNLQDYQEAIKQYNKMLGLSLTDSDLALARLNIARANFYQNNFFQAESEISGLLSMKIPEDLAFEAFMIRANIALTLKEYAKSVEIFKTLLKDQIDRAINANIPVTLSVCFEELNDFKAAISILEQYLDKYPSRKDYLVLKLKRLKERQKNQPGAKGLKK